jgi:hypothetical protein
MADIYFKPGDPLDDDIERWYPVFGFEGVYEVSTHARIRRILGGSGTRVRNGEPYFLSSGPNSKGYWIVNLWKDGIRSTLKLHKIVAKAFLGDPPADIAGDFEVHHIDNNKDNNYASNLEYLSAYDNMMEMQHRYYKTGRAY